MKLILFETFDEAQALIDAINVYLGSTYATPIETDEGWSVPITEVATSGKIHDLPSMMVGKTFVPPVVDVGAGDVPGNSGTLAP